MITQFEKINEHNLIIKKGECNMKEFFDVYRLDKRQSDRVYELVVKVLENRYPREVIQKALKMTDEEYAAVSLHVIQLQYKDICNLVEAGIYPYDSYPISVEMLNEIQETLQERNVGNFLWNPMEEIPDFGDPFSTAKSYGRAITENVISMCMGALVSQIDSIRDDRNKAIDYVKRAFTLYVAIENTRVGRSCENLESQVLRLKPFCFYHVVSNKDNYYIKSLDEVESELPEEKLWIEVYTTEEGSEKIIKIFEVTI